MEQSPFDGCVFRANYRTSGVPGAPSCWRPGARAPSARRSSSPRSPSSRHAIPALHGQFPPIQHDPGRCDWFGGFLAVLGNARPGRAGGPPGKGPGILFDVEQYEAPLFSYPKQRDAGTKSGTPTPCRSGSAPCAAEAFPDGYPGLTLFLTSGYSVPWAGIGGQRPGGRGGLGSRPAPDGMLGRPPARPAWWTATNRPIITGRGHGPVARRLPMVRDELLPIAQPAAYRRRLSWASAVAGLFPEGSRPGPARTRPELLYPRGVRVSRPGGPRGRREYVWIYTESPRWWSADGTALDLPRRMRGLRRARQAGAVAARSGSVPCS